MKKLSLICILIVIVLLAVLPVTVFAAEDSSNANRRLIKPVAVAAVGNNLFVADNVDEANNQSVILCFDIATSAPAYKYSMPLNQIIVNISEVNGDLCVVLADEIQTYTVSDTALTPDESKSYRISGASDITYGNYKILNNVYPATYVIDDIALHFYVDGTKSSTDISTKNAVAALYFNRKGSQTEFEENFVYYIAGEPATLKRFNCSTGGNNSDPLNLNGVNYAGDMRPRGILSYPKGEQKLISVFYANMLCPIEHSAERGYYAQTAEITINGGEIVDMTFGADKIFLLNSNHQIETYTYNSSADKFEVCATIGTDTITIGGELPTAFTGFTLAKSTGYPTNIIYKTGAENSIEDIITPESDNLPENFIILNFDGADQIPFYYVLVGDKFGWIQKSDGISDPSKDPKILSIDTRTNRYANYSATSFNAVAIYQLPRQSSAHVTLNQSITNPLKVDILQVFTEKVENGTINWFYVRYNENQYGFMQEGTVGHFKVSYVDIGDEVIGTRKINSSLFEAVKIYSTRDMSEENAVYNEHGDAIKLYSGKFVTAIYEEGDATFIEVNYGDGTTTYGWMPTENLISQHGITTNAIVGISILGAAIIIAVVFMVVFLRNKKKKLAEEEEDPYQDVNL